MQDITDKINESTELSAVEVEDTEGTDNLRNSNSPVLATPAALAVGAFGIGVAVGKAVG